MLQRKQFKIRKQKDGVTIHSANGKKFYAALAKLDNGVIIRSFVFRPLVNGIVTERLHEKDMRKATRETLKKLRFALL